MLITKLTKLIANQRVGRKKANARRIRGVLPVRRN